MSSTTIWHIADLHIERKRHAKIKYAFDQLLALIKTTNGSQYLCIVGDVFEHKTKYSQADLECFHYLLKATQEIPNLTTIIMPGNHDFSEAYELDLISAALINTNYKNVFHYSSSAVVVLPEFDLYILSPIDQNVPPMRSIAKRSVAMIHEPVKGCKAYGGITISEARFDAQKLSTQFDLVLLGDIHKKQFMQPNVAYCGSLVQKTKAEDFQHGCIKWTLSSIVGGEFINFDQIDLHVTVQILQDKVLTFSTQFIKSIKYLEVVHANCSKSGLARAVDLITKKFGVTPHSIRALQGHQAPSIKTTLSSKSDDPKDAECELIDEILKENSLELYSQEVKDLHTARRTPSDTNRKRWRLISLTWANIFCYGENNSIDFTKLYSSNTKVFSLIGRNKTGKSSILDILTLILFNHISRGTRSSIIHTGTDAFSVECCFQVGSDTYKISRTTDRHETSKCTLVKYCDDVGDNPDKSSVENISGGTIMETYERMRELVGEYKDFANVNVAFQGGLCFTDTPASLQRTRILQFLDLDHLHTLSKKTDQEVRALKKGIKLLQNVMPAQPERKLYHEIIPALERDLERTSDDRQGYVFKLSSLPALRSVSGRTQEALEALLQSLKAQTLYDTDLDLKKDPKELITESLLLERELMSWKEPLLLTPVDEYKPDLVGSAKILQAKLATLHQSRVLVEPLESQKPIEPLNPNIDATHETSLIDAIQLKLASLITQPTKNTKEYWQSKIFGSDPQTRLTELRSFIAPSLRRQTSLSRDAVQAIVSGPAPHRLAVMQVVVPPRPAIPVRPSFADSSKSLPDLQQDLQLLKRAVIDSSLQSHFRFSQGCQSCTHNQTLFKAPNADQNAKITALQTYIRDAALYKRSLDEYNAAVAKSQEQQAIEHYLKCMNDKEWFEQQDRANELQQLEESLEARRQVQAFEANELVSNERQELISRIKDHQARISVSTRYIHALAQYKVALQNFQRHQQNELIDTQIAEIRTTLSNIKDHIFTDKSKRLQSLRKVLAVLERQEQIQAIQQELANVKHNTAVEREKASLLSHMSKTTTAEKEIQSKLQQAKLAQQALSEYDRLYAQTLAQEHELAIKQAYSKCLSLQSGISERLLNQYLDTLEARINTILLDVTDFTIKFARTKDSTFVYTIHQGITISADLASGFQKFIIDLALRIAFVSEHHSLPNFLVIDEGFGCLDQEHLANLREFLAEFNNRSSTIDWLLIISHIEELSNMSKGLRISSENGVSSIKF